MNTECAYLRAPPSHTVCLVSQGGCPQAASAAQAAQAPNAERGQSRNNQGSGTQRSINVLDSMHCDDLTLGSCCKYLIALHAMEAILCVLCEANLMNKRLAFEGRFLNKRPRLCT